MAIWDNLPILIALPLALTAAGMSGNAEARQRISLYLAEALKPHVLDLGGDPAYFLEPDTQALSPLPTQRSPRQCRSMPQDTVRLTPLPSNHSHHATGFSPHLKLATHPPDALSAGVQSVLRLTRPSGGLLSGHAFAKTSTQPPTAL